MESDARVSGAWNADTCSGKTRLSSRCAPCACRIHNSASAAQPEARCRRFENYLAERFRAHGFPSPPSLLFTRRSVARGGLLRSLQIFPSTRPGSRAFLSLFSRTHARTRTTDRREYVSSSASSFSSACEDKRTSSKTDRRSLALHDTPRVIKRGEETRELLCITRDAREPWFFFFSLSRRGF